LPIALILGSFFVILSPLALLTLIPNFVDFVPLFLLTVVVELGGTHFFVTLILYFQSANLDYFSSSTRNRIIYFVIPVFILVAMAM